jgi:glycosyltransferase involved in cell wall biosynthesis
MSILYISHGHPRFARGGGELAAYRLFDAIRQQSGYEKSGLLAAAPNASILPAGCQIMGLQSHEWLIAPSHHALVHDSAIKLTKDAHGVVFNALKTYPFQLIHAHHYVHIGIDLLIAIKTWFPSSRLILTLHEYWAMCAYEGRLLRRNGKFCNGPSPMDCLDCVGHQHRQALAVRRLRIQNLFEKVDCFISPSYFLKERYVDWGLSSDRIHVIENMPHDLSPSLNKTNSQSSSTDDSKIVFAYFGQANPWKGIDHIIESFLVIYSDCPSTQLHLNGLSEEMLHSSKSQLEPKFAERCAVLLDSASKGSVVLRGSYEGGDLSARMADANVVVMASRWYENAPMVIQESFSHGLPVIAPRLGGMAEKIQHRQNGLLFDPFNPTGLTDTMRWCISHPQHLKAMSQDAESSALKAEQVLYEHLELYKSLTSE